MVGWVGEVGWGGLLVLYLKDVTAERQYSSMVFHGDLIEIFYSPRRTLELSEDLQTLSAGHIFYYTTSELHCGGKLKYAKWMHRGHSLVLKVLAKPCGGVGARGAMFGAFGGTVKHQQIKIKA